MVGSDFPNIPFLISPPSKAPTKCGDDGRCLRGSWLGGSFITRRVLPEQVASKRVEVAHQSEGGHGSIPVPQKYDARGGLCAHVLGQSNCRVLYKSNGGDKIKAPMCRRPSAVEHGAVQKGMGKSCLGATGEKSVVRYAVKDSTERLGSFSIVSGSQVPMGPLVHTPGGCLRQQEVPCSPHILQLVPGPPGPSEGCILSPKVARENLLLPPGPPDIDDIVKDSSRRVPGNSGDTRMEDCSMVGSLDPYFGGGSDKTGVLQGDFNSNGGGKSPLPPPTSSMSGQGEGDPSLLTESAKALLDRDIREGTHKIYRSRFKIFSNFCYNEGYDPSNCPIQIVANFLTSLKNKGLKYGTICGYRSAISRYHSGQGGLALGETKLVKRITKACFQLDPPIPRYGEMWNADVLMQYLGKMHPNSDLSLKDLGIKTAALISILSLSRQSTVAVLGPEFQLVGDEIVIPVTGLEKTSRPGHLRGEVVLPSGDSCPPLSLHYCISEYLARTEQFRLYHEKAEGTRPSNLFVSNNKPHQSVTATTLAKWLLAAMDGAGIDTSSFKAHSTRSSGASSMRNKGLSLAQVLKRGYWSDRTRTFEVFYDRSARQPAG